MNSLRKIVSLFMAILILVSTTGLSVHAHSCAGELQDFSFYQKAEACAMEQQQAPSCHAVDQEPELPAEPCCDNHAYQLEEPEETVGQVSLKVLKPDLKLVAFAYSLLLPVLQDSPQNEVISDVYQLPPIARDIPVFVQSFLL